MSTITLDILWRDRGAAKGLKEVGAAADQTAQKWGKFKTVAGVGALAVGAAILKFGKDSVSAYTEAQTAQAKLAFAFQKFPKLADTNQASLQKLNSALQLKTKFDDDAIASGQAVLAQYDLTGKQLERVTPLLLDYAAKTGKDLPAAASAMGKAFLGNTRALKEIGINYKSTGDQAKDFANITKLMRQQVGGFAEAEGKTAAGQFEILKNQIGELQEAAGSELLPAVTSATKALTKGVIVVGQYSDVLIPVAAGLGVVATAVWGADKALKAWAVTQAVVSKLGPKTAASITAVGTAAAAAGIGLAAVAAGGEALDRLGTKTKPVDQLEESLSRLAAGQADLNDVFAGANWADELQGLLTTGITPAKDLQSALKGLEVTQSSTIGKISRWRESITPGTQSLEKAEEQVGSLDQALASMVSKGNGAQAAAALQKMGVSSEQVAKFFPQYSAALKNSSTANSAAASSMDATKTAAKEQAAAVQEATDKLYANANAAIALSGSQIGMESAIDAARKSLKENGKTLDVNTEKGRSNRQALNTLASATLQYTDSLVKSGASAEKVVSANERGRSAFLKTAKAMKMPRDEAIRMADALFKIPENIKSQVVVAGGKVSAAQAKDLNKALKSIPKEQRSRIVTIANTKGAKAAQAEIKKVKDKQARIKFETDAKRKKDEANRESAKTKDRSRRIDYNTDAKRVKDLANRETEKAKNRSRKIDVNQNAADARRDAQASMNAVRNVTRYINVKKRIANAAGGPLLFPGYAGGGRISGSGGPTEDNIAIMDRANGKQMAWGSVGEFMTNAAQYRKNRDAVETINAGGEWDLVPRRAGGGLVGAPQNYVSAGGRGGVTIVNHYTVNAPNYFGPQRELVAALVDLDKRGALRKFTAVGR